LLMRCLAKNPASRPANAREFDEALSRCQRSGDWTREMAEEWWRKYSGSQDDKTVVMPLTELKST